MIEVVQALTATNTDVLAGTQLDQVPGPGIFTIYAASTVADGTVTVSLGQDTLINAQVLLLRVSGNPNINEDVPIAEVSSPGGVRPVINYTEVTAATAVFVTVFE